ncbi:NAD-dependent malic enzyme [Pelagibaculum spongiae]|uniref:NAD-dependent malic enzyme n=1 Tax=Pelagibaculum spongiae TaxID=2080658 RepID=A0A2V1GYY5_9GAMM|nr:NAD-dependent malic enzyme [Pelagibaculum spongiae]PVZ67732.1 NAD-dependent malic enzyme [Pelagibaculum spongiae]
MGLFNRLDQTVIETSVRGTELLEAPLLNKGTAFTAQERSTLRLDGLLPCRVETMQDQLDRAKITYNKQTTDLRRHVYLRSLQDNNETLFYAFLQQHLTSVLPIIYTPTVGKACQLFSEIYRKPRGLFISHDLIDSIDQMLANVPQDIKVIVVTDGERILGLGDLGIGGIGISIGKLSLYTAIGGIDPYTTLPVTLDAGTNNQELLDDPNYLGHRYNRLDEERYYQMTDAFIAAVKRRWPKVLLQFEDFAITHASPLLARYQDQLCCFNDDIQGTASVTLGTILAAAQRANVPFKDMRVTIVGAGSAGSGIAETIIQAKVAQGATEANARAQIFMVDRLGLVLDNQPDLYPFQQALAHPVSITKTWGTTGERADLLQVVEHAKPHAIVGVCGQPGIFTEAVMKQMAKNHSQPIIMPLSNPTARAEAIPEDVLNWTEGKALVATGSPFNPVKIGETEHVIAQCNNTYIFPGIGLGVLAAKASRISENMLQAAALELSQISNGDFSPGDSLLPPLEDLAVVSHKIAVAVAKQAIADGYSKLESSDAAIEQAIEAIYWRPKYQKTLAS